MKLIVEITGKEKYLPRVRAMIEGFLAEIRVQGVEVSIKDPPKPKAKPNGKR